jgi:cytosine/adenosine deaminase-related metal-dependent hydrolase
MDKKRRIIANGAVAFEKEAITGIGKTDDIRQDFPAYTFLDMGDHIIMPGLVNCHVHLTQALIKGCADDVSLIEFLANRVWRLMGNYGEEVSRISAELCLLEMLKSGTTAFAETLLHSRYGLEGITQAVIGSGIRGILAKSVMDIPTYASRDNIMDKGMREDGETCLKQAVEWKKQSDGAGDGRIHIWLGPRPVGSATQEILKRVGETAKAQDMGIAIHFCEVPQDVELMRNWSGRGPGEFAESMGILTDKTLLAHGVWLEPEDMEAIRRNGSTVVHCPASNAKLASGFCKVPELLAAGVNVALGTDAATCDNTYDMFRAMYLTAILHKGRTLDPLAVPAETVLEMATLNGAKGMKLENEIGSLEVGKKADIIAVNCNNPRIIPNINPVSALVYSAHGDDVDTVIINGQFIVRDRKIKTMDEERIVSDAKRVIIPVLEKAGVVNKSRWPLV